MGNRRGGNILIALGVVLALIGGGLTFVISQTATNRPQEELKRPVVIARSEFLEGALVTTDKLEIQQWPESIVPPGSISDLKDLNGKFAKVRIPARTPLVVNQLGGVDLNKLATNAGPVGAVAPKPATFVEPEYTLDKGQVLVVVNYPNAASLISAGALRAGSMVDIIIRTPGAAGDQIAPIFRNIRVRAVGNIDPTQTANSTSLIFAVSPQDALILKFLESMSPDLLLRAAGDTESSPTDLVTQEYMIRRFRLERPAASGGGAPAAATPGTPGAGQPR